MKTILFTVVLLVGMAPVNAQAQSNSDKKINPTAPPKASDAGRNKAVITDQANGAMATRQAGSSGSGQGSKKQGSKPKIVNQGAAGVPNSNSSSGSSNNASRTPAGKSRTNQ